MRTIVVANPKGGSGKTTLATHIAGWLAGKRQAVAIADFDPQQSAVEWLARRPSLFPPISRWDPQAPKGTPERSPAWLVVDTPAGVQVDALREVLKRADVMIVPVSPSAYDMTASQRFLAALGEYKAVKQGSLPLGLVAMRVDSRTHSAGELDDFLRGTDIPVIGHLRDAQVYVHCARDGSSVFDLPRSRAAHDWDQWRPLTRWISRQTVGSRQAA
ncbi:MAG: ParA family protein [Pseudomonadota bacterium]|nr:ParA family protein [Pseudomonadota bacterium]